MATDAEYEAAMKREAARKRKKKGKKKKPKPTKPKNGGLRDKIKDRQDYLDSL